MRYRYNRLGKGGANGSALVNVMMILTILTLVGIAATRMTLIEQEIATSEVRYKEAFYQADAGVSWAMSNLDRSLETSGLGNCDEIPVPDGSGFRLFLHRGGKNGEDCKKYDDSGELIKNPWIPDGQDAMIVEFRSESVPQSSREGKVVIFGEVKIESQASGERQEKGHKLTY